MILNNHRGFTLVEIIIASAIASLLLLGAIQMMSLQTSMQIKSTAKMGLEGDFLLLEDFFVRQIAAGGGNALSPLNSYWVEDNCASRSPFPACDGSDRLTILTSRDRASCTVTASTAAGLGWDLTINSSGGCCLQNLDLSENQGIVIKSSMYAQVALSNIDEAACTLRASPGPASGNDSFINAPPINWAGAVLSAVSVRTFYRKPSTNELHSFVYTDANSGEDRILADQIYDFQAALGYDFNPTDGLCTETEDGSGDEWLGNRAGTDEEIGSDDFLNASLADLKMLSVGIISGYRDQGYSGGSLSILNGPARDIDGWKLSALKIKTVVRSQGVFE
ncbi:MAG TPA: prepilin-type N-terminal cleavage/methylation domain-containing protein [Bdellovibrionales bacterium]|nr:prepilin-type N-terminal cleavage/methylation domain-containing protein [Bdellovibrionales bacterium]